MSQKSNQLLRYKISSWKELPQCMSNNSRKLHLHVIDVVDEFHLVCAKDPQKEGESEGEPDQDPREGEKQRFREQGEGDFPLTEPEYLEGRDVAGPL